MFAGIYGSNAALVQLKVAAAYWKQGARSKQEAVKTEEVRILGVRESLAIWRKEIYDKNETTEMSVGDHLHTSTATHHFCRCSSRCSAMQVLFIACLPVGVEVGAKDRQGEDPDPGSGNRSTFESRFA